MDNNVQQSNKKQIDYNYRVGDMVKLRVEDPSKLEDRFKGPYCVHQVNTKGMVLLQTRPVVTTPINLQKIKTHQGQLQTTYLLIIFNIVNFLFQVDQNY